MNRYCVSHFIKIVEWAIASKSMKIWHYKVSLSTRLKHSEDGERKCILLLSSFIMSVSLENNAPLLDKMRKSSKQA